VCDSKIHDILRKDGTCEACPDYYGTSDGKECLIKICPDHTYKVMEDATCEKCPEY